MAHLPHASRSLKHCALRTASYVLVFCSIPLNSLGQFSAVWTQTINPSVGNDNAFAIALDATGVYVSGMDDVPGDRQWRIEKRDLSSGALIGSFGTSGVVTSNPTTEDEEANAIAVNASGVYVVGYDNIPGNNQWRIEKRDLTTGALIAAFGSGGIVTSNPSVNIDIAYAIALDANALYVAGLDRTPGPGNGQWRIEKRDLTTGALIAAFGAAGVVTSDPSTGGDGATGIVTDGSALYVTGYDNTGFNQQWRIEKRDATTGALITGFGVGGSINSNPSPSNDIPWAIAVDASGVFAAGHENVLANNYQWRIEKRDLTSGTLVVGFGTAGIVNSNPSGDNDRPTSMTANATGLYVAGWDNAPGNFQWRVEKRDLTTGDLLCFLTTNPSTGADAAYGMALDTSGIYLAGKDRIPGSNDQWRIAKYDTCLALLPLDLLSLEVVPQNDRTVKCTWLSLNQRSTSRFLVERSLNGVSFEQVGIIDALTQSGAYIWYDDQPYAGVSYYRVIQEDRTGESDYSAVRAVRLDGLYVTLYPNPVEDKTELVFALPTEKALVMSILDALGRVVQVEYISAVAGLNRRTINLPDLASGSYSLTLSTPSEQLARLSFMKR